MNNSYLTTKEEIVYKKVSELKNNPKNPRKNDNAVDSVALSIKKYGFKNPLIIDTDNIVWCGNTRLKAAKKLKLKEVPCIVARDLTPKQMEEYALLDNKTNEIAEWDMEMLSEILPELDLADFDIDWGIENSLEFETEDEEELEVNEVQKKLCKCPVCGHINEEKAFKYYEDTE